MKTHQSTPRLQRHSATSLWLAAVVSLAAGISVARAQVVNEIFDLGPDSRIDHALLNPYPGQPWPSGLFLSAWTAGAGYTCALLDAGQDPLAIAGTVDAFPLTNRRLFAAGANLLATGDSLQNGISAWHVRGSEDGGGTWVSLMSDWQLNGGGDAKAKALTVTADGSILVCGRASDARGRYHPIIRRSRDAGMTWTTVLDGSRGANFDTVADIQFVPSRPGTAGGIFAAGRIGNSWIVWRSLDGGTTWPTVFSWSFGKNIAEATSITCDATGNLFVGGMANRANGPRNWYVFASFDSGTTWRDLGCPLLSGTDCILNDLQVDPAGTQLWAVGSQGQFNWRMQRWDASGWTAPIYPYSSLWSRALAVVVDNATGTFYATGSVQDSSGLTHGTVLEMR